MSRRTVSAVIIAMLLTGILTVAFNVQPVKSDYAWTETIYIHADGSIDPSTAPISSVDNVTYTLTGNIAGVPTFSSAIVIQRDNIIIDGAGHTLQGTQAYYSSGIVLTGRSNVTIKNTKITAFGYGIWLETSINNSVNGNNITNNYAGIYLHLASGNSVSRNTVANNSYGIVLGSSSDNSVSGNNITANAPDGISLDSSNNNSITGNNITASNDVGIYLESSNYNSVSGNNITNDTYGIYLVSSSNIGVSGNNITANTYGGIVLGSSSDNSVSGNNIANNWPGVYLVSSSNNNSVSGNNITNNTYGISLDSSSGNSVSENNITANTRAGIDLSSSSNNSVSGNNITNNVEGIYFYSSNNSTIYHNNFINNTNQVPFSDSTNVWDDGYPSGGNYWSDYNGADSNGDGIGDTPYVVDANNTDRYPLMAPYSMFYAGTWNGTACSVGVMSNSTVSEFKVDVAQKTIGFNVTGAEGSIGFCRVTIPNIIVQNLWQGNYTVLVDGKPCPFSNWTDTTNTYVYFNYTHSQHQTVIIPELPSSLTLPILMIVTLLATIVSRRKWSKHQAGSRQHLRIACNK